jgi:hypothetical protein
VPCLDQYLSRLAHFQLEIGTQLAKLGKALSGFLREGDCDRIDASIHARRS